MIEKVLQMTGRLLKTPSYKQKKYAQTSPELRLVTSICMILLCALSGNGIFTITVLAGLLLRIAFLPEQSLVDVLKPLPLPVLFTVLIMLPAVFMGQPRTMLTVTMKVAEAVLVLALFNEQTEWRDITSSLRTFHVSPILILTLETMIRFLIILGRYSTAVTEAVMMRRVGPDHWKTSGTGGILGLTYLKSQRAASETSEAMECRLFDGEYKSLYRFHFRKGDLLLLALIAFLILFFIVSQRTMNA